MVDNETAYSDMPEGFDALVANEIQPLFDEMRHKQAAGVRALKKWGTVGALIGMGLGAGAYGVMQWPWFVGIGLFVVVMLAGLSPGLYLIGDATETFSQAHLRKITEFLGLTYQEEDFTPPKFHEFTQLKLVKKGDRQSFKHLVFGEHHGQPFSIYEAKIEERRVETSGKTTRVKWVTIFDGQLLHAPYPRKFACTTIIARDAGWFNFKGRFGKKLKPMGLASPKFEKLFEVYTSDQVEGRVLVDPAFMARLLELESDYKKRKVTAAFSEQAVFVALHGSPDFFGSLGDEDQTAERVARETVGVFDTVFHFLDEFKGVQG